jgi:hypothetical protein
LKGDPLKQDIFGRLLIAVLAMCLVTACAGVGVGVGVSGGGGGVGGSVGVSSAGGGRQLAASPEAAAEFEKFLIRQDYNYYYSGSDAHPNAIMGLDKRYVLTNDLWKKVDLTPERLKDWLPDMHTKALESRQALHGFVILDGQGNRIGTWYSVLEAIALMQIKLQPDNGIWIDTPPQDVYHEYDRGRRGFGSGIGGGLFLGF